MSLGANWIYVVCCEVKRGVITKEVIRPNGVIGVSSPNEEAEVTTMAPTLFAQSTDRVYWSFYLLKYLLFRKDVLRKS